MKKLCGICFLIFFLFFCIKSSGFSQIFNSPNLLEKKKINLSTGSFLDGGLHFGLFVINEYGILDWLNSVVKLGFVKKEDNLFYGGVEARFLIARRFGGTDWMALSVGSHYTKNVGIDLSLFAGNKFFKVENYLGFDFNFELTKDEFEYPGDFVLGAKFQPFKNEKHNIVIEGGIPVTSFSSYKLGVAYIFIL